jgi:methanogenic corrinoid protein MtbC1
MRRTGLGADLLRAWERRYGAVVPTRSAGGQRLYSEADIARLQLLRRATESGHAIGQVATLDETELRNLLQERSEGAVVAMPARGGATGASDRLEASRRAALAAVLALDDEGFETILRRVARSEGSIVAIEAVVVPVMREVGERWIRRELSPAHEHMATAVVERTLHWLLDTPRVPADAPRIAVATTQGERHELGMQIVAVVAAAEGWRVITVGADLPAASIVSAASATGAQVLALSFVSADSVERALPDLELIRSTLPPGMAILVGGAGAAARADALAARGCIVVDRLMVLQEHLARFASRAA